MASIRHKIEKASVSSVQNYGIWTVDRVGRLIAGISNIIFLISTIYLSPYFLIGIGLVNFNLILTSITDKCALKNLLMKFGYEEREDVYSSFNNKGGRK